MSVSNLSILQRSLEAYKCWHRYYAEFPRLAKFTLGSKIDVLFYDVIELLLYSGYASREQKSALLIKVSTKLDALKFFLQIAWELKYLDHKKYGAVAKLLLEVGKMLGGWQKQLQTKTSPPQG